MHRTIAALLVVTASASVLVLELLSVRLVAPYVGVSHETYTAAIGVALGAIAVGAALGGRAADVRDCRPLIGWLLLGGGAFSLLARPIVFLVGPALRGAGPVAAIILVSLAAAVPIALLSAVPPAVVKLQLARLAETGSVVGWFSALGTLGGLAGTFLTGYVLLYALPVSVAMIVMGVLLVALGVWQLLVWVFGERQRLPEGSTKRGAQLAALLLLAGVLQPITQSNCEVETPYFCARVVNDAERETGRYLLLDDLRHAYADREDPTYLEFAYTRRFADVIEAAYPEGRPLRVLHIGGGGFTMPRWLEAVRPGSRHTVLELDRHIAELAAEEFGVPPDERIDVRIGDARMSIGAEPAHTYDVVIGDAFTSRSVPWHLATAEFYREVRRVLSPDGVFVLNVIDGPDARLLGTQIATTREVFGTAAVLADTNVLAGEVAGNHVIATGNRVPSRAAMVERTSRDPVAAGVATKARVDELARGADVLTDDWAPVDQLLTLY